MKRIYGKKFVDEDNVTILTDEEEIKDFIEEVEENLENAEIKVEF